MKLPIALCLLFSLAAMAADITGKWSGNFKAAGSEHRIPQLIILKQHGSALSGTAGPNSGEQYPIENGKVEGNKTTFQVTTGEWKFTYSLTAEKDSLSGELKLESASESRNARVMLTRINEN